MRTLDTLEESLLLKRDQPVARSRFLDTDLLGKAQRAYGPAGFEDQAESFVVPGSQNANGFRILEGLRKWNIGTLQRFGMRQYRRSRFAYPRPGYK